MVFHLTRHPGRCIIDIEAQKKGPSMADNTSQHESDTKGGPALSGNAVIDNSNRLIDMLQKRKMDVSLEIIKMLGNTKDKKEIRFIW